MEHGNVTVAAIEEFLRAVDMSFPVPLSEKQELSAYAEKLHSAATICAECEDGKILSMVAGYTENLTDDIAYIAVVATKHEAAGRGLASGCVRDFINVCKSKSIPAVHLYTDQNNHAAKAMYRKLGFVDFHPENEPRPEDAHLIYRIEKES